MKKQLNIDQITSELTRGSAFFPGYKGSSSPAPKPREETPLPPKSKPVTNSSSDSVPRTVPRPVPGTPYPVPPFRKRHMKQRQPFDIYEDQYEALKQAAEEDRELGLPGSMSALVRRGIDLALEERKQGKI